MTRECEPSPLEELHRRDNHAMSTSMHTHRSVRTRGVLAELPGAVPLDWLITVAKGELDNA